MPSSYCVLFVSASHQVSLPLLISDRGSDDSLTNNDSYEAYSSKRNQAEVELERSAHNETSKALDLSEEIVSVFKNKKEKKL